MKSLKYALLAISLLVGGGLVAETKAQVAKRKAAAAKLKEHEKHYKTKKAKTEKAAYTKKPVKHETKKVAHTKTTKAVKTPTTTAKTAAKPQEKSYFNQVTDALGWTGGTTGAAATAATTAAVAGTVNHRGPEGFYEHHKMPYHWKHGWTGGYYNGEWQFAGHNLQWWYQNYPSYYKNVVRPEATKAGITERQHFAHEGAGYTKKK